MFLKRTYQDYEAASNSVRFLVNCVDEYKQSDWFKTACAAERYADGETDILQRTKPKMEVMRYSSSDGTTQRTGAMRDVPTNQVPSDIFGRLVDQRVQYLFQNGMNLENEKKAAFGEDIDEAIESCAEFALLHGECYLFWAYDHAETFAAASSDGQSGMFFLLDEMTGAAMLGVRFWRINDDKPMYMIVYRPDGYTLYKVVDGNPTEVEAHGYIVRTTSDALGTRAENLGYARLPFAVLAANRRGASTLTPAIKQKIDVYDVIVSDFADNLERMEGIYWAIKNFGGTSDEAKAMLAELETLHAAVTQSDTMSDADMDAHPESIEAPWQARQFALKTLRDAIYEDYMALDMSLLSGGSLTNVAIETAKADLDLATNKLETQAFACIRDLLDIIGAQELYNEIGKYSRQQIANQMERVEMVYTTGLANDLPRGKRLELTGLFEADEIEDILTDMDAEDVSGIDEMEKLQQEIEALRGGEVNGERG